MTISVPYLRDSYIEEQAGLVLEHYHPSREIPIPIEKIVDNGFRINIDYQNSQTLNLDDVSGFLAYSRNVIYVDEYECERYPTRYRFTLAHELGHYVLHESYYKDLNLTSLEDFKKWRLNVTDQDIDRLHFQANLFAGLLMVPSKELNEVCNEFIRQNTDTVKKFIDSQKVFWEFASKRIAKSFDVSPWVINIRLSNEKIPENMQEIFDE